MKLNLPQFFTGRKNSLLWLVGLSAIVLAIILLILFWPRGESTVDSAMKAYQTGDLQQALDLLAQARDKNQINTAEEWNFFGNVYRDTQHLPEAIELYRKAIQLDSSYEPAYRNLSYVSVDLAEQAQDPSKLQEAIGIVERGRQSHPKSVMLVEDLIMLYSKAGETAKAGELKKLREELLGE